MKLESRTLIGRFVRLEPLAEKHREELRAACEADRDIWEIYPYSMIGEHFDPWWRDKLAPEPPGGPENGWTTFAVVVEGVCVGVWSVKPSATSK
jgi:hypothetical protein